MYLLVLMLAFTAGACLDFTWARCVKCVQSGHPARAAHWAAVMFVCGLAPPYFIVAGDILAIAAFGAGCWVGTYYAVVMNEKGGNEQAR